MKLMPVFFRYGYGLKSRGDSMEYTALTPLLREMATEVHPFWIDEHWADKNELQRRLMALAEEVRPDLVFFMLMKDEFTFETLDWLKERFTTVNWFGDDPWRFESFSALYAPHFTFAVTTDKFAVEKYRRFGCVNVILSQWASFGVADHAAPERATYEYDISFVGMFSGSRQWIIRQLRREGYRVACFGHGWPGGMVPYERMQEIFRISRINLNLSNSVSHDVRCVVSGIKPLREFIGARVKKGKKTADQIKARNFEIPAFGGFQLTNYVPGLEDYFDIGREIAVFSGLEDLKLQAAYYLSHEDQRRSVIRAGHECAKNQHLFRHRFADLFERISRK